MKVHCPDCQGIFGVEGPEIGSEFDCPYCRTRFSFRDKATVVVCHNPETHARFEPDAAVPRGATPLAGPMPPPRSPAPAAPTHAVPRRAPTEYTNLTVGDLVGGYRLEEVIGWGGMSVVFRASQLSLDRNVALKVLRKDLAQDPEFAQRFLKEARTLADLSHPNIVQVIDQGIHEGNYFLVMEYIDGVSLRDVLSEKRLSPAEALRLVPALCAALEYAHQRGVVHRDIKPENLMLTRAGVPKIADFGLARIVGRSADSARLTKTQTIMGTIEYMAPEQREGNRDVDHRADIYSLGVVLYEMLTGELPIARFPLPSEKVQVDVRLDEVVLKVLEKDRDRRYQRASLMATDLERVEAGLNPSAHAAAPESVGDRILGLFQNPLVFIMSLLCLAAVIGNARDEVALACLGAAAPLILTQAVLHGLLPRPLVRRDRFFYRHPVFTALALVLFTVVLEDAFDDATHFLVPAFLSAGLCAWRWRERAFRGPGEAKYWAAGPNDARARQPGAARVPRAAAPVAAGGAPVGPVPRNEPPATPHALPGRPAAAPEPARDPAEPRPELGQAPERTATPPHVVAAPAASPRQRVSWLVVLGFMLTIGTLLYVTAIAIGLTAFDWDALLTHANASYSEISGFLRGGVWSASPAKFGSVSTLITLVAFSPLLLPLLINLLALIPLQSPRKRGGRLLLLSWFLLGLQLVGAIGLTNRLRGYAELYQETAAVPASTAELSEETLTRVLDQVASSHNVVERLALLHRSVELGRLDCPVTPQCQDRLLTLAMKRTTSPVERVAMLITLDELAPDLTFPSDVPGADDWIQRLARAAISEQHPAVRDAYLAILRRTNSAAPKQLFWEALASGRSPRAPLAVEWWTEYAPIDAVEWLGKKYTELPQPTLVRWLQRLETSSSARFVANADIRAALLGPLLEHPDAEVRHRAAQLLEHFR
ncbi:MAG: protein kinase [Planctomycetota bacterium]